MIKAIWVKKVISIQICVPRKPKKKKGGEKEWESEIMQKELLIPRYSTHPSEEMALIRIPNYSNVVQSTSIGVSISSQD